MVHFGGLGRGPLRLISRIKPKTKMAADEPSPEFDQWQGLVNERDTAFWVIVKLRSRIALWKLTTGYLTFISDENGHDAPTSTSTLMCTLLHCINFFFYNPRASYICLVHFKCMHPFSLQKIVVILNLGVMEDPTQAQLNSILFIYIKLSPANVLYSKTLTIRHHKLLKIPTFAYTSQNS